jgi:hypothetical protein
MTYPITMFRDSIRSPMTKDRYEKRLDLFFRFIHFFFREQQLWQTLFSSPKEEKWEAVAKKQQLAISSSLSRGQFPSPESIVHFPAFKKDDSQLWVEGTKLEIAWS